MSDFELTEPLKCQMGLVGKKAAYLMKFFAEEPKTVLETILPMENISYPVAYQFNV
jgi:hypothetical protein